MNTTNAACGADAIRWLISELESCAHMGNDTRPVWAAIDSAITAARPPAEWVLASKFEELTGITRETVKQRKKSGVWREGLQVAVVHRRLYVNIKAADQWIKDQLPQQPRPA